MTHTHTFDSLVNIDLLGLTSKGLLIVQVEDLGTKGTFYVKDKDGNRFYGSVDANKVFTEILSVKQAEKLKADLLKAEQPQAPAPIDDSLYILENICGGNDAAGGGCGGPLSLTKVSKEEFDKVKGTTMFDFLEHTDAEASREKVKARDEGKLHLKAFYRACSSCRKSS